MGLGLSVRGVEKLKLRLRRRRMRAPVRTWEQVRCVLAGEASGHPQPTSERLPAQQLAQPQIAPRPQLLAKDVRLLVWAWAHLRGRAPHGRLRRRIRRKGFK